MDKELIEKSLKRMYELYYYALHDEVLETDFNEFVWLETLVKIESCGGSEEEKQQKLRWLKSTYNECDHRKTE